MSSPGIARLHRHGVEDPLPLAGLRIERLQEAGRVEVVARADEHVVADDDRRHRREVLLVEVGDLDVPALLAGPRVERDEVVVGRLEEQVVVPDRRAAVADVRAAPRLPEVVPELVAVARVERPDVVGRRHVEHAVDLRIAPLMFAAPPIARSPVPSPPTIIGAPPPPPPPPPAETAAAGRCRRSGRDARDPRQREVLHGRLVDLRQRAVAPARVVARVGRPRVGERLAGVACGSRPPCPCAATERRRERASARDQSRQFLERHFRVTR